MKLSILSFMFAALLGSTVLASAANNTAMSATDSKFANNAAAGGMAEVQLGQLALKNASSPDVKAFAQRMVTDHTKAGDQLKTIASRDNISIPSNMDAKDKATYDRLSKLQGSAFDKAYMRDMVRDHNTDISAFQKESTGGRNEDLKQFASNTLPTLEEHLKMAEDARAKLK